MVVLFSEGVVKEVYSVEVTSVSFRMFTKRHIYKAR